jgi:GalNAc5-diNAcBac-PP-undecaprenol beta-1,3-glucosyltransferase
MSLAATVLIPTHDHGPTLLRSVRSALAQTVHDIEVLVVGDGAPDVTREIMAELTAADDRVRFFDNPKGPRHGEAHRHAALQEASGEIVCYLCDDDLWLPGHVEELRRLLADADFAHSLPFWIDGEGAFHPLRIDLALPYFRELLLSGENRIPLSCGAHTMELYRRLPAGWRAAPADTYSDLYMWQQILAHPGCRAVSGTRPTVIHLPAFAREGWSEEQRLAELDDWATGPELEDRLLAALSTDSAALEDVLNTRENEMRSVYADLVQADSDRSELGKRIDALGEELHESNVALASLSSSVTWRLRGRLVGLPLVGRLFRSAAKALAGGASLEEAEPRHPDPTREPSAPATGSRAPDPPSGS